MTTRVRMTDLAARHAEVAGPVESRVLEVLRSGHYIGGDVVDEAEQTAARWFGRAGGVGTNSGTDALMLALQAVGVTPEDEVIVPALSFFSTAGAVAALGATPVIVDVGPDGCIDPLAAARARTTKTKAVIPVHLYGNRAKAPDLGVPVVDDAAQAIGGTPARSLGVLTAVSTYPTKTWGSAGDGGFVVGDDPELLERVRALGHHGMTEPGVFDKVGPWVARNSRLDAIQAAVLLGHAEALEARVERRRAIASRYDTGLPAPVRPLHRDPGSPVHQYCICVSERDRVVAALQERGIDTRVYYSRPLNKQPALERRHPTPIADRLADEVLALPVHAGLSNEDVDRVLVALRASMAAHV